MGKTRKRRLLRSIMMVSLSMAVLIHSPEMQILLKLRVLISRYHQMPLQMEVEQVNASQKSRSPQVETSHRGDQRKLQIRLLDDGEVRLRDEGKLHLPGNQ